MNRIPRVDVLGDHRASASIPGKCAPLILEQLMTTLRGPKKKRKPLPYKNVSKSDALVFVWTLVMLLLDTGLARAPSANEPKWE